MAEEQLTIEETIARIFQSYLQQELGNKVSQFSVQGLSNMVISAIKSGNKNESTGS